MMVTLVMAYVVNVGYSLHHGYGIQCIPCCTTIFASQLCTNQCRTMPSIFEANRFDGFGYDVLHYDYRIGLDTALMKQMGVQITMISNVW